MTNGKPLLKNAITAGRLSRLARGRACEDPEPLRYQANEITLTNRFSANNCSLLWPTSNCSVLQEAGRRCRRRQLGAFHLDFQPE